MQQLDHNICAAADIHDTAYLKDERDNKKYWVTKLEDGHCWMSQNLDLDLYANTNDNSVYAGTFDKYIGNTGGTLSSTGVKLTKDNTDITDDVLSTTKMPKSTIQNITLDGANVNTGNMSRNSWDQGLWVINDPTSTTPCAGAGAGFSVCGDTFTDVSGPEWTVAEDPNFTNLSSYKQSNRNNGNPIAKTAGSPIDTTNHVYDAHYLAGNFYQFNAATAGSVDGVTDVNAPDSLCPVGWKLPSNNTQENMLSKYGITRSQIGTDISGKTTNIILSPLFYVRSGGIDPNGKARSWTGTSGDYWSTRTDTNDANKAHYLYFGGDINSIFPSYSERRYLGWNIRCVLY